MIELCFLVGLIVFYFLLFWWAFKTLPLEKWQILAAIPIQKTIDGNWQALNLTYYGFFTATAYFIALSIFLILMNSVNVPYNISIILIILMLIICIPASKLIAYIVEKNPTGFTVGGASFVGIISAPILIYIINLLALECCKLPIFATLSAIAIAYAFGEGTGRLACISFGCCYGKCLDDAHPIIRKIFHKRHFVFYGKTKKIAYEHDMDGKKVLPIQAITAVINIFIGIIGLILFLYAHFAASLILTITFTQLWRILSEFLRADYRGNGRISLYQKMSIISIGYVSCLVFLPTSQLIDSQVNLLNGIIALWKPEVILLIQFIWLLIFIYTGKSVVTASVINFFITKDKL